MAPDILLVAHPEGERLLLPLLTTPTRSKRALCADSRSLLSAPLDHFTCLAMRVCMGLQVVLLTGIRLYVFHGEGKHYLLYDFCYWANGLSIFYTLWAFEDPIWLLDLPSRSLS